MKQIKIFLILAFFILSLPVNAESDIADSPWPMLQHDMFHTGYSTFYGPDMERADENDVKFKKNVAAGTSSPVIDVDGTVYIGSTDGCVYKVSPDGEESDCIFKTGGPVESTPVLTDDGTIYVGSNDGSLYAITTGGAEEWSLKLGDKLMSSPAVGPNERIFIGSSEGSDNESSDNESSVSGFLYSITSEGEKVWKYPTGKISYSSPAIDQFGNVYIGSTDGILHAVSSEGSLLWEYQSYFNLDGEKVNDSITTSPVISAYGAIYFTTFFSLVALDYEGNEKWIYTPKDTAFGEEEDSGLNSAPAVDKDGKIYVGDLVGNLFCLVDDGSSADVEWSIKLPRAKALDLIYFPFIMACPLLDNKGTVYVRSQYFLVTAEAEISKVVLYAVNGSDGEVSGIIDVNPESTLGDTGLPIDASIALGADRTLYVASGDGYLYAFGPIGPSISGTIAGDEKEGVTVFLKGAEEERLTVTGDNGEYIFRSLYRGEYLLTPDKDGWKFNPPSRDLTLRFSDREGIDFTSEVAGLAIVSVEADPSHVPNDSETTTLLTAEVYHPLGQADIESVKIDLSEIGGTEQEMYDDGNHGDKVAGDGIYSYSTVVESDTPLGPKAIKVIATDTKGVSDQKVLTLEVVSEFVGTVITCSPEPHTILIDTEGQNLVLSYVLLSGDVSLILKIFSPSNNTDLPDYEVTITSEESRLEIEDAEEGEWRLIVCVQSPASRLINQSFSSKMLTAGSSGQYSISSATSGTGVVYGKVTDAETGEALDNVSIMTNTGGSSPTEVGYYLLLNPAGVLIITASDSDHMPASKSVSLISGSSVEVNVLLLPKGLEEGGVCPSALVFDSSEEVLGLLKKFRGSVLGETSLGRLYINKYYHFAPEVTAIISSDPVLRQEVKRAVIELLPMIEKVLGNEPVTLDDSQTAEIKNCLERIKAQGSMRLKKELDSFMERLDQGRLLQDLNLL